MITLALSLWVTVPEDSNSQYLLDKQIAHYFESWEVQYDSLYGALRTSQGCLDLLNWYVDLDAKYEVKFGRVIGLRYRNRTYGDYGFDIRDHIFQPFFQLYPDLRLLLSIAPHYYKGEDELGLGFVIGRDYMNYFETLVVAEDFDRNFSLQHDDPGPDKITYRKFPVKFIGRSVINWKSGRCEAAYNISLLYRLQSTEQEFVYPINYSESGRHDYLYLRVWQDIQKFRIGGLVDFQHELFYVQDTITALDRMSTEVIIEPMFGYRFGAKWFPHVYLSYNHKTQDDSTHYFFTGRDSLDHYDRDIYAYLIDVEYHTRGNFVWHVGLQQQFYYNSEGREFLDRRINVGVEYRYKNVWFYFVEAMEGDFPTPKWMHNHTYVQLMLKF
jgi:hypothetical protein